MRRNIVILQALLASGGISAQVVETEQKLDQVVVSASRTPERIISTPVTIERMGVRDIKIATAPAFYDGLDNLKEVQLNNSSILFKSINTRGFAAVGNTRFLQLVDNMDGTSPALNFPLGNLVGLNELDVESMEILPGASSALYGANAFNGIMFMNSKNPFTYQGVSAYGKYGKTTQDAAAGMNDYLDYGLRLAKAFTPEFAMKANASFIKATDWYATDYNDVTTPGRDRSHPNYDGINVYGDEVSTPLRGIKPSPPFAPNTPFNYGKVSRTGYQERDLTDYAVKNFKADMSAHFKPFGNNVEVIVQGKIGTGNTIYQAANRYMLKDFMMQQHRVEVKGDNFFVRGYMTTENSGDTYNATFAAWNINRSWKSDPQWFTDYTRIKLGGGTDAQARGVADKGRLIPGTDAFKAAFDKVTSTPGFLNGSKFLDKSRFYHSEGNYNFRDEIKFAEVQVGGSYRVYDLNSQGTLFTDTNDNIRYDEYGMYTQVSKKMLRDDRLKLTGSVRYDKSQNFTGNFSPRISAVYTMGAKRNQSIRASYQTGFRNPTSQDQYIGLDIGAIALIGSTQQNLSKFSEVLNVSAAGQIITRTPTVTMTGNNAFSNAFIASSVAAFAASGNPALLKVAKGSYVKPEQVKALDIGYRASIKSFTIDVNAFRNEYTNFLNYTRVISPYYGNVNTIDSKITTALVSSDFRAYQLYTNTEAPVNSYGFGIGITKKLYKKYELGANYTFSDFEFNQSLDTAFIAGFNTPKHKVKASFGGNKVYKNLGFNTNVRWNTEYVWQSAFTDGMIPENTVFDAQLNYTFPELKSLLKLGATNLFGKDYIQVLGAGAIGQQYFVSWTYNP